jgi:hypothetical protein
MKKFLACFAFLWMSVASQAATVLECQNSCQEVENTCSETCTPDKGPMGILKCAKSCSDKASACVKKTCTSDPKPSSLGKSLTPLPLDWDVLAGNKPKPLNLCDCDHPERGGCEKSLCRQRDGAFSGIFKAPAVLMPSTCGFCQANPGSGLCKVAKSCYDVRPITKEQSFEELKRAFGTADYSEAQVDMGRATLLNNYLKNAGAVSSSEHKALLRSIGSDSEGIKSRYKDYWQGK